MIAIMIKAISAHWISQNGRTRRVVCAYKRSSGIEKVMSSAYDIEHLFIRL